MKTEKLNYNDLPSSFVHCFNSDCPMGDRCLRRQAAQEVPAERKAVACVNPMYYQNLQGQPCDLYLEKKLKLYARGFKKILASIPYAQSKSVQLSLRSHFGQAMYYRIRSGERPISPKEQEQIRYYFRQAGVNVPVEFDAYEEMLDV